MKTIKLKEISPGIFGENGENNGKEIIPNKLISVPVSFSHISYLVIGLLIGYYFGKKNIGKELLENYGIL